ncbi:ATP-dependent helicase [Thermodesulfobacteriota bacterium]
MPSRIRYETVLNIEQLQAVSSLKGPVLVIAGAGSGKTRTLIYRVARLIEEGVDPENILLLTFTRKAAAEMLERAAGLTDERCQHVSGGTFHSLAHRVLRNHANLMGFDNTFTILDRADMEEAIQSLVKEMQIDKGSIRFPRRSTLANILSKAANLQQTVEFLMGEEYAQFLEYSQQVGRLRALYRDYKRKNQFMDYDDLIIFLQELLSENDEVRMRLSKQYRYILVDEYQDTNGIQADIVKWLAIDHRNIMVVGDDSQSIYSFRGANYKNMFDFPGQFPETKIIKLEENYRSTQPILTFTNALMAQAHKKYTKCLYTHRKDGDLPRVIDTRTAPEQANFISNAIKEHMVGGRSLKDFAVLFRAAYHSFDLELELTRQGIPFVKYGGFKFMESAHIKDFLAYLRVIVNKEDPISWGRSLRLVKNIGQGKSQEIMTWMKTEGKLPWQVAEWPRASKSDGGLGALSHLLRQLSSKGMSPERAVDIIKKYYVPILQEKFDDFPRRQKDLEQLHSMAMRYTKLRAFLDDLMLEPPTSSADMNPEQRKDCLTLSTVHSAKGLEWPVVFIIWAMEGYFPSSKAYSNPDGLEEERRLMYVAATRAKDELIICYPIQEAVPPWQLSEMGFRSGLSSFIQDLPEEVAHHSSPMISKSRNIVHPSFERANADHREEANGSGLRKGDRVEHPAFGRGVVSKIMDREKIEVLFMKAGRKLLHLSYTTLEKL